MKAFFSRRRNVVIVVVIGVLLLAVGVTGLVLSRSSASTQLAQAKFREASIGRGDLRETISATGPVEATQKSNLAFLLSGAVQAINVVEGQEVRAGDLLMALDTSRYELDFSNAQLTVELQRIAFNQLVVGADKFDVAAARAAISRAASQLAQLTSPPNEDAVRLAQQNYELQQNNLWRIQAGRDQLVAAVVFGRAAQYQVDEANKDIESAELAVKIAEQQIMNAQQGVSSQDIAAARANLAQSQASLNRLLEGPTPVDVDLARVQIDQASLSVDSARLSIKNAQLTAPFGGVVAKINFEPGEQAGPGQTAVVLLDNSSFHIDMLVDEVDIARISQGQLAFIKLDAAPDARITGHVSRIAPDGVTVRGVVSYEVRVEIDTSDVALKDGLTATVDIVVSELTNILLVPNWAIRFDKNTGDAFVNIRRADGTVEEIKVDIGQRGESLSEVRKGLAEGDTVVVSLDAGQLSTLFSAQSTQAPGK